MIVGVRERRQATSSLSILFARFLDGWRTTESLDEDRGGVEGLREGETEMRDRQDERLGLSDGGSGSEASVLKRDWPEGEK